MITLHVVLWALVNAVWQSAVLAAIVFVAIKALPRTSAAQRYAIWGAVLVATALLPFANLALAPISYHPYVAVPAASEPKVMLAAADAGPGTALVIEKPLTGSTSVSVAQSSGAIASDSSPMARQISLQASRLQAFERAALGGRFDGWLIVVWIALANLLVVRLAIGYLRLSSLKKSLLYRELTAHEREACALLTSRPIAIGYSSAIREPCVIGFADPVVALPLDLSLGLTIQDADRVVRHECAHIGRWDDYANLFKQVLIAVFCFNPVVHAVAKALDLEREIACDDAAAPAQSERAEFARCLCDMALSNSERPWLPVTGLARNKRQLVLRIARLLDRNHASSTPLNGFARAGVAAVALAAVPLAFVQLGACFTSPSAAATPTLAASCTLPTQLHRHEARAAVTLARVAVHATSVAPAHPARPARPSAQKPAHPAAQQPVLVSPPVRLLLLESREAVRTARPALSSAHADAASMTSAISSATASGLAIKVLEAHARVMRAASANELGMKALEAHARMMSAQIRRQLQEHGGLLHVGFANGGSEADAFLDALHDAGYRGLGVEDLITLRNSGVSPEFLRQLRQAGIGPMPAADLIALARAGVDARYLSGLRDAGYGALRPTDIVELCETGIQPSYLKSLAALGYRNLAVRDLIRLAESGVTADFIAHLEKSGVMSGHQLSVDDLVRLSTSGL